MKKLSLTFIFLVSITGFTQTKPVAYRSHSGNMKHFSSAKDPDNLGWGGVPINFENTLAFDSMPVKYLDTSIYPYCNNPSVSQDSLKTNFPLYTKVMENDSAAAKPTDTLARPKEHIMSHDENRKNATLPVDNGPGNSGTGNPAPGFNFIVLFTCGLILIGSMIWLANRKKVISQ